MRSTVTFQSEHVKTRWTNDRTEKIQQVQTALGSDTILAWLMDKTRGRKFLRKAKQHEVKRRFKLECRLW